MPSSTTPLPRWERPAKYALLLGTLVGYLWNLGANGWANSFYSAAVQAGSVSWEAFLFGSSDASNSITVDKPPASLWPMELSVRIFGLNSWAILVPEVLMGVGTVWLLYSCVRRYFGPGAALLAGSILAVTPVAALMFRFNNPDALLVLLLTAATVLTLRAIETERVRWLVGAGVAVGFAFLTKQLQAFLVLPALVAVYAYAGPRTLLRRTRDLLAALAALVVSAGWWVAIVELTPASSRPYVGGSQHNSFLELTFGYNGFGRLTGNETGSVTPGGGGGGTGMWGATGIWRLFETDIGGQIAWLLPTALILLIVGVVLRGRLPRTDPRRAVILAFGGTMLVTTVAFSFMAGIFHAYYTVALAPFIAAVVAGGAALLWERRATYGARAATAAVVGATAIWSWELLNRSASWMPGVRVVVALLAVVAIAVLLVPTLAAGFHRRLATIAVTAAIGTGLVGPAAYAAQTIESGHSGSIPTAGPTVGGAFGGPGGQIGPRGGGAFPRGGVPNGATFGSPTGAFAAPRGQLNGPPPTGGTFGGRTMGGARGGMCSVLSGSSVGTALKTLLEKDGSKYTWVAAAIGSNEASGYQLATQLPVMPIGGFNGSDPYPSLAQFEKYVAQGKIHYFISGGGMGQANGGSNVSSQISSWVEAHFTAKTVDGVTIYDLTSPTS
ncbi:MAG: ArnT family glycosyltransferase [Marmoricola sp.]